MKEKTIDYILRATWQAVSRMYNEEASKFDGSMAIGFALLSIDKEEGTPSTAISSRMGMEATSLTRTLKTLEEKNEVLIITQNIDDLHEKAGSSAVIHLHGEIMYARSSKNPALMYKMNKAEIRIDETCELGSPLRPHVVWFGEAVPMIEHAAEICGQADVFMLVGTSLAVYPAASLIDFVPSATPKYIVDKKIPPVHQYQHVIKVEKLATAGIKEVVMQLLAHG